MKKSSIIEKRREKVNPEVKQKDLALRLGKKESEISRWMRGTHNFTIDTLISIEDVLGEPIIEICHSQVFHAQMK